MKIHFIFPLFLISIFLVNCSPKSSAIITQSERPIIIPQAPNVSSVTPIEIPHFSLLNPSFFLILPSVQEESSSLAQSHSEFNHETCPICHMGDQVIPIIYGRPGTSLVQQSQKGEVILGGCTPSTGSPRFMCKRDEARF